MSIFTTFLMILFTQAMPLIFITSTPVLFIHSDLYTVQSTKKCSRLQCGDVFNTFSLIPKFQHVAVDRVHTTPIQVYTWSYIYTLLCNKYTRL